MSNLINLNTVAIDPVALFLHGKALEIYWLLKHPHVPPGVDDIRNALREVSLEERKAILERAKMIGAYAKAVEEAVTTMPKEVAA